MYASIALKDRNVSSVVVEISDHLGGHTETYTDPESGVPIDYGVVIFHNADLVRKYFGRFNIPLTTINFNGASSFMYDFTSGKQVIPPQAPDQQAVATALAKYAQLISQWPELTAGLFVPDPVPDVLSQPLLQVAQQYGFEAALPLMATYNPGLGDPLTIPLLEVIRVFNLDLLQTFQAGFLTTAAHNNSMLYTAATAELAADDSLLLSSYVQDADRTQSGISLIVKTPKGKKLIKAKKLLITIPTKLDYLKPFDLDNREASVFAKFLNGAYYTSVVKNSGLPPNSTTINAKQNTPFMLAPLPGVVNGQFSGSPKLHTVYYQGPRTPASHPYSDHFVKSEILAGLNKLHQVNPQTFPQSAGKPEFVRFSSHSPFYLQVRSEDIKNGFYKDLYALQGIRGTFYADASLKGQDSSGVWQHVNDVVLPQLLASLRK